MSTAFHSFNGMSYSHKQQVLQRFCESVKEVDVGNLTLKDDNRMLESFRDNFLKQMKEAVKDCVDAKKRVDVLKRKLLHTNMLGKILAQFGSAETAGDNADLRAAVKTSLEKDNALAWENGFKIMEYAYMNRANWEKPKAPAVVPDPAATLDYLLNQLALKQAEIDKLKEELEETTETREYLEGQNTLHEAIVRDVYNLVRPVM